MDGKKGIEGALGHGTFGTGTGCGGRLARDRDDEVHEELGQLEVVNGGEAAEGTDAGLPIGRVVAAAWEDRPDGVEHALFPSESSP